MSDDVVTDLVSPLADGFRDHAKYIGRVGLLIVETTFFQLTFFFTFPLFLIKLSTLLPFYFTAKQNGNTPTKLDSLPLSARIRSRHSDYGPLSPLYIVVIILHTGHHKLFTCLHHKLAGFKGQEGGTMSFLHTSLPKI